VKDFFNNTITLNILFFISYFFLAIAGFHWGSLTASASLLWPPSGLAVFGFLVFGRRIIPGLLFGAVIASQSISLSNPLGSNLLSYTIGTVNGSASILQAYIIARLSRTYYLRDFQVTTSSAFNFTLIVFACCTIAASISNFMLWQINVVRPATAVQNWVLWWSGDVIGILITTPLLLWIHHRKTFFQQSQENAFFIFSVGAGIVVLAVAAVGHKERETFKINAAHATNILQLNLQAKIDLATRELVNLKSYFSEKSPQQHELTLLADPLLKRNSSLESFSWIDITSSQVSRPMTINAANSWTLIRSGEDGFAWKDWELSSTYTQTLTQLLNTRTTAMYDGVYLTVAKGIEAKPIASIVTNASNCIEKHRHQCPAKHLLVTDLNLTSLMQSIEKEMSLTGINIQLAITLNNSDIAYLQWNNNQWNKIADVNAVIKSPMTTGDKRIPFIKIMDNEWQIRVTPKEAPSQFLPNLVQCGILLIGFSLVALLSAYLQSLYRQDQLVAENQDKLKEEIEKQTEALRAANDWLLKEIEERRTTQEQLKASEAHMRTLLDNIPDPVWFKSVEGAYLSINKAVTELFYRQKQEVVGNKAADYIDADFAATIQKFEDEVLTSHSAVRQELWMHIPSKNEHRLMDTIKVAMRDQNDTPIGILSIARDITEQHKLIDELEKFKRFSEFASEGFSIMSLQAETLYMNRSMQRMLLSNQALSHNNFLSYFPPDLHDQWRENIFPFVLLKGYWQGELAAMRADGSRFPTKATFFVIRDDKARPLYIGEIMSDISEQKQIEMSLQLAKQTAEEATHAKSRFLANMSHEIRTPLNAILGYSQLFMTDTQLSAQQQERMQSILKAGQRLLHLINDILDLSKIEAGVLHFRQDYFDLHQELNDISAIMRAKAIAKGLTLNCDIVLPAPAIVQSDRQKIGQIILNLLGNAIKFTHTGEVNLKVQRDDTVIVFTIMDTGPGISAQELQSLFAAFKQGKAGEESGGTGLGLVISKHIAESLGGELTLDSEPGKGTRALLRLPLAIEHSINIEPLPIVANAKLADGETCSVLVVEDDPASRDLLVNLLRDMGCEVNEASNGKTGLEQALARKPDIIFTDIRMPELTGTEMLKALRKTVTKAEVPVIAVSASSLEHERNFYLAEGFHEFIGKPYEFGNIYSALRNFAGVKLITLENTSLSESSPENERACWKNRNELITLRAQLLELKTSLNSGDVNTSKKLFSLQSTQTLGKAPYQKIQNAIRQYDLVLAEQFLDELLNEMITEIPK
jgi:PAS domain S-box-containing protein